MAQQPPIYGIVAEFDRAGALVEAVRAARRHGYRRLDAYSPYPIEEMTEALELGPSRLPLLVLIGGILGGVGGFFMQYYASVIGYPMNVGGRPLNSWPAYIPVTFEMTILVASLTAVLGMLALNGLPQPYHPLFHVSEFALASRDRFFLCIQAIDPKYDRTNTNDFLLSLHPIKITEVPH